MKVLFNAESLAPPLTGIGEYTQQVILGLLSHEAVNEIFMFSGDRWVQIDDPDVFKRSSQNDKRFRSEGRLIRRNMRRIPGLLPLYVAMKNQKLRFRYREMAGDIYHETNYVMKPFVAPCVTTIHDLSHLHFPGYHPSERVKYFERGLPKTLKKAAQIITCSEFVRTEVIEMLGVNPEKVTAVPLGVGDEFRPRRPEELHPIVDRYGLKDKSYILAVGSLEPRKNLGRLFDAYEYLPEKLRKQSILVHVGPNGWRNEGILDRMQSLERKGLLRRLGYLPRSELPMIFAGARMFAFPSEYEGFGLPPLEAMACGVPVIASDGASIPEVVGEAGVLVDPDDTEGFSKGIEALLRDERYAEELGKKGRARSQLFTWGKCVNRTVEVYRKVVG